MMDYAVICEGEELARYPERLQAEIFADGFNTARRSFDTEDAPDVELVTVPPN